jgi:hypothetical protein
MFRYFGYIPPSRSHNNERVLLGGGLAADGAMMSTREIAEIKPEMREMWHGFLFIAYANICTQFPRVEDFWFCRRRYPVDEIENPLFPVSTAATSIQLQLMISVINFWTLIISDKLFIRQFLSPKLLLSF